jgi:hypothetical protein
MFRRATKFQALLAFLFVGVAAFAQVPTGEIKGTVVDPGNAVVPKADIVVKDAATGLTYAAQSGAIGDFLIPSLLPGTFSVTVTAPGFQRFVITGLVVETGRTLDVPVKLTLGAATETVEVTGAVAALETTSSQIATTVRNDYIAELPYAGRDVLNFATLNAGYASGTFNGLFQAAINVNLDGTNVNDTRNKSGTGYGFDSVVALRLDAIDEVTTSTTGLDSSNASGGAMTIQFTTKRGTSQYHGSLFEEVRNSYFNANSWSNNVQGITIAAMHLNDFGGNLGGPLKVPFVPYFKNKLFFFVNFEENPVPGSANTSATLLLPSAQAGNYTYLGTDGLQHTVNVLTLAGQAGFQSTIDPTVASVLSVINGTTGKGTLLPINNNFFQQSLAWKIQTGTNDYYPTGRLDYQITPKVAWHIAENLHHYHVNPTASTYPGLSGQAGENKGTSYGLSNQLDWIITPTIFNSFRVGIQSHVDGQNIGNSEFQWASQGDKRITFGSGIRSFIPNATPHMFANPNFTFQDDLSWVKGKHTFKVGAKATYTRFYESDFYQYSGVLNYTLGVASNDPAYSIFNTTNFPALRSTSVSTPRALYATLTGRISSIGGYDNIDEKTRQFAKYAPLVYRENYFSWGPYFQDSFRATPSLTLNFGFRWEFTGVMTNTNNTFMSPTIQDVYSPSYAQFQPGVLLPNGAIPSIGQRSVTYAPDHLNPAPNFGFAWNPTAKGGPLGKLLGDKKTVVRGSYGINFFDEGLNVDYWVNTNAGNWQQISATSGSQFTPGSLTLQSPNPTFLTAPPAFTPPFSEYQFAFQGYNVGTTAGHLQGSGLPVMKNPYVQAWNIGIQRELAKDTVLEVRYVGNKTTHKWRLYGVDEVNIFENGFLKEFQNAQNNLAIANGMTVAQMTATPTPALKNPNFSNAGLAGQVPLPIFQTAFGARGSQPALSSGSGFGNTSFITDLQTGQAGYLAEAFAAANSNSSAAGYGYTSTWYCRLVGSNFGPCNDLGYNAPGPYPINFFTPNPYCSDLTVTDDNSWANYNALQVEFRRRLHQGLTLTATYTLSHALSDLSGTDQTLTSYYSTNRDHRLNYGPTSNDRRHSIRIYGTYELPFGKDRLVPIANPVLNRILGGWVIGSVANIVSGAPDQLTGGYQTFNSYGDSLVQLQGMSVAQFRSMVLETPQPENPSIAPYALQRADPKLFNPSGDGTVNPSILAPWTGAGTFGQNIIIYGPWYVSFDASINKNVRINDRVRFEIQAEMLNALNHPEFGLPDINVNDPAFGQVTSSQIGPRNVQLRAYLRW